MCTHALSLSLSDKERRPCMSFKMLPINSRSIGFWPVMCASLMRSPPWKGFTIYIFLYFYQYFSFSQIWDSEMESHLSLFLSWWHSNLFLFSHAINSNMYYYYSGDEEERTNKLKLIKKQTRTGCYTHRFWKSRAFSKDFELEKIILNFFFWYVKRSWFCYALWTFERGGMFFAHNLRKEEEERLETQGSKVCQSKRKLAE